jgi:uncharacterized glyoxalase superfamily protein PhnB
MGQAKPIPEGYHSVIPQLCFKDAAKAIDYYVKTFGAKELSRMPGPGGKIWHCELQIGDSRIFLMDVMPGSPIGAPSPENPASASIMLYVPDVDETYRKAVSAGAKSTMDVADMFWGDRGAGIIDPFGYAWFVATHVRDMSEEETRRAAQEEIRKMESMGGGAHA